MCKITIPIVPNQSHQKAPSVEGEIMSSSGCYMKWPCLIAQQMALKRAIKELITVMQLFICFYGILPLQWKEGAVGGHHKMVSQNGFGGRLLEAGRLLRAFPGYQLSSKGWGKMLDGLWVCPSRAFRVSMTSMQHHPLRGSQAKKNPALIGTQVSELDTCGRAIVFLLGVLPRFFHPGEDLLTNRSRGAVGRIRPAFALLGRPRVGGVVRRRGGGQSRGRRRLLLRRLLVAQARRRLRDRLASPAGPHAASAELRALVGRGRSSDRGGALEGASRPGVVSLQSGLGVGLRRACGVAVGVRFAVAAAAAVSPEERRVVVVGGFLHLGLCGRQGLGRLLKQH